MFNLSNSLKKTISIADGYKLGRLVFEGEKPYIELEDGKFLHAKDYIVEVLNDDEWYRLEEVDYARKTAEGWRLFGGFECRYKVQEQIKEPKLKFTEEIIHDKKARDIVFFRVFAKMGRLQDDIKALEEKQNFHLDDYEKLQQKKVELAILQNFFENDICKKYLIED